MIPSTSAFVQRLHELGWIDGRTVAIEYRFAEGRTERFAEIAAEFVRLKVDVIVTSGGGSITAKQATSIIPIVVAATADPIGSGLVASLVRPGGNVTGLSAQSVDIAGKRLALLREAVPSLRRFAMLGNVANPLIVLEMGEVQAEARTLGLAAAIVGGDRGRQKHRQGQAQGRADRYPADDRRDDAGTAGDREGAGVMRSPR
jgi:putative tryptophan/tyrosine transport system substrate-binding protein